MIKKILTDYTKRLNEYLTRFHNQPEGLATVGLIGKGGEDSPCKMVVSLLNLERETAGGIGSPVRHTSGGYVSTPPPILLNLNVMMAAVYDEKRYAESLSVLSSTLTFVQSTPRFSIKNEWYTVEMVPLSTMDLHNIWTTMGGQYYPSVVCKIRRLVIDAGEIKSSGKMAQNTNVET